MATFQVPHTSGSLFVSDAEDLQGIGREESYMLYNGRLVSRSDPLVPGRTYYVFPRVLGGKGGFGSMLRAIGAQIEKTTSREACRDLSGRRIRDVNNEKKLKDWVAKQAERSREKEEREERRRAKRAKYLQDTPAKMNNPQYDAQYSEIMKNTEAAIQQGLARLREGAPGSRKRKAESTTSSALDKYDRWNMMGGLNPDDIDSDSGSESGASCSASPGTSSVSEAVVSSSSSSSQDGHGSPKTSAASATVTSSTETSNPTEGEPPAKVARLEVPEPRDEESRCSSVKQEEASSEPTAETGVVKTDEASQNHTSPCNGAATDSVQSTEPIDLDQFNGPEDLHALGMDRLKMDLMRRGLKCGGSLEERAQRLFSVKGLSPEEIPAKLQAKGKGKGKGSPK